MKINFNKDLLISITIVSLLATIVILATLLVSLNGRFETQVVSASENRVESTLNGANEALKQGWSIAKEPEDMDAWNPFKEMARMEKEIDQIFGGAFGRFGQSKNFNKLMSGFNFSPKFDLTDNGDHYLIQLDIPGAESSEFNINIEDQTLDIGATSKQDESVSGNNANLLHRERRIGSYHRRITLPELVDGTTLESTYKDGVLKITIDKVKDK